MNPDNAIRNFRDFLQIYNNLSETCFNGCVDVLNSRSLEDHEIKCVNECGEKFIKLNHRLMASYVTNQQIVVSKRIQEAEEQARNQENEQLDLSNSDSLMQTNEEVSSSS